jgi:hypothetical protein
LPFVTSRVTPAATLQVLRCALREIFSDRELFRVRENLLLEDVNLKPDGTFARVLELERAAGPLHHPTLL